jgi:hypothetical protein
VRRQTCEELFPLGQVHERLGKKGNGRQNYRKLLEPWKNADPGLPEVEDAEK